MLFEIEVKNIESSERIKKFKSKISTLEELIALYRTYKDNDCYSYTALNLGERFPGKMYVLIYVNTR